jgi:hypothetical protein
LAQASCATTARVSQREPIYHRAVPTLLAELEKPGDLAAQVVAGLRQGGERDVAVAQAEVNRATAAAGSYESAEARLPAEAAQGGGAVGTEESARRAQLSQAMDSTAPAARATDDQLNAKPVAAAPAVGKAALRALKARWSPDRSTERSRER